MEVVVDVVDVVDVVAAVVIVVVESCAESRVLRRRKFASERTGTRTRKISSSRKAQAGEGKSL